MSNWPGGQPQSPYNPYQPGGPYKPGGAASPSGPAPYGQPPQWSPYPSPYQPVAASAPTGNGLAVASLVLGITSVLFFWWGLLTLAQVVLAIVFGSVGISRANRGAPHRGLAIAGLLLGMLGLGLYFLIGLVSLGIGWVI